ncbi:MAG TPA: enoyl-CoA hydratase/isomerase family protein [Dehalococcoidia bacterium]|nr:enoyl-CoA hydratase/isomerase family protein [Dehalococcoidia bacterium]
MPAILYEVRDGVARVTLNRPEVLNAINLQMRDDLWSALDAIEADDEAGVVVFRGAGDRAFSAGADISEFGTAPSYAEARRARLERDLWGRLAHFDKPLIAAVHGYALGAGCELSLLCDFRIVSEDARFGLPETHLGYVPTAGGSQTLPRTIGRGRALDMILSAEPIDAATALAYGLVHRVVPREELDSTAEALARRLLAQPQSALRMAKRLLAEGADLTLAGALDLERRLASRLINA